jgi:hypothetical protein
MIALRNALLNAVPVLFHFTRIVTVLTRTDCSDDLPERFRGAIIGFAPGDALGTTARVPHARQVRADRRHVRRRPFRARAGASGPTTRRWRCISPKDLGHVSSPRARWTSPMPAVPKGGKDYNRASVRHEEVGERWSASRCSSLAGGSPASVSASAPSSRPRATCESASA